MKSKQPNRKLNPTVIQFPINSNFEIDCFETKVDIG